MSVESQNLYHGILGIVWGQLRPTLDVLLNGNKDPGGIYMSNATEIICFNFIDLLLCP